MPMYSRKSAMHWTMWSKSCREKVGSEGGCPGQGTLPPQGLSTNSRAPPRRNASSGTDLRKDQDMALAHIAFPGTMGEKRQHCPPR